MWQNRTNLNDFSARNPIENIPLGQGRITIFRSVFKGFVIFGLGSKLYSMCSGPTYTAAPHHFWYRCLIHSYQPIIWNFRRNLLTLRSVALSSMNCFLRSCLIQLQASLWPSDLCKLIFSVQYILFSLAGLLMYAYFVYLIFFCEKNLSE